MIKADKKDISVKRVKNSLKIAMFAGGCFWCMVPPFHNKEGVVSVIAGYTGGKTENPSYEEVSRDKTGHYEAVQIEYDAKKVSYDELLDIFWKQIDPTDVGGQFADRGSQYKTAIFYHDDEQRKAAEMSKKKIAKMRIFRNALATEILKAERFYPAEEYHQDYYRKKPVKYKMYKIGSGRESYIKEMWREK